MRKVVDTDILTSQVCVSRLTATLLSPMTIAKKEYQLLYSLQLQVVKKQLHSDNQLTVELKLSKDVIAGLVFIVITSKWTPSFPRKQEIL